MCMRELWSIRDESLQTGDLVTKRKLWGMHHELRQEEELEEALVPSDLGEKWQRVDMVEAIKSWEGEQR